MNSKKENSTPMAPRREMDIDTKKAYDNLMKQIRSHNQQLLESIIEHCPEGHIIVISRIPELVDPRKWMDDKKIREETKGVYKLCPGDDMDVETALERISTKSIIRRFWYIQAD